MRQIVFDICLSGEMSDYQGSAVNWRSGLSCVNDFLYTHNTIYLHISTTCITVCVATECVHHSVTEML